MHRLILVLILASLIPFTSAGVARAESGDTTRQASSLKNPLERSDAAIAAGKRIYDQSCVTCHAEDGKGEPGMIGLLEADPPDLTDARWSYGSTDAAIFTIIANGTQTGMEPFKDKLSERQIWRVVHFLRSIVSPDTEPSEPIPLQENPIASTSESVTKGQKFYLRDCARCHGTGGRGHTEMADLLLERPTDLTQPAWKYGTQDGIVYRIIREGTPNDMPSFKATQSEAQTWNVVNYLRSLRLP